MRAVILCSAFLLFFILPRAWGDEPAATEPSSDLERSRALYEEGVRRYDVAEYEAAAEAFKKAYLLSPASNLLFNIAQALRKQGRCKDALEAYQSYLRQRPDAADRAEVEARLIEMKACAVTLGPPPAPPPPPIEPPVVERVAPPEDRGAIGWLPWVAGGLGTAAAVSGAVVLGVVGGQLGECTPRCEPTHLDQLKTDATAAYLLVGGGVATGLIAVLIAALTDS